MLVNWNLLVSVVKLVSSERVTCSFVGVTCSFVSVTCSFVGVTCSFVGVTCSFDAITFRFVIAKWWILQHIYSGENSVEKGGESFANFRNIYFDFAYYSYLHSSTNRKLFHAFVYVLQHDVCRLKRKHSDAKKIYMLNRMRNPTVLLL